MQNDKLKEETTTQQEATTAETNKSNTLKTESGKKEKKKTYKYLQQKVYLPSKINDFVEYIKSITLTSQISDLLLDSPLSRSADCQEVGKYFLQKCKYIPEICGGILAYIAKNVALDAKAFSQDKKILPQTSQDADEILKNGTAYNPEEVCILFKELCANAGVKVDIVDGYMKNKNYKIGDSLFRHKWCSVITGTNEGNSKYYLIDPFFCLGHFDKGNNEYVYELKPYYLFTPPEFFIENHLPDKDKYQMISKPLNVKEFTRKPLNLYEDFYQNAYKFNIILEENCKPELTCTDNELQIHFQMEAIVLDIEAYVNNKKLDEKQAKLTDNGFKNHYIIYLTFPTNGEYKISLNGKPMGHNDEINDILTFSINVKILNIIKHEIVPKIKTKPKTQVRYASPDLNKKKVESTIEKKLQKSASDFDEKIKKKCFDNGGVSVYEPKDKILRLGQDAKFKVKVRRAKYVAVLDGRKWNYLKRKEDDMYEGSVNIKNESVVIVAMRNNNLYTEVAEFLALKKI